MCAAPRLFGHPRALDEPALSQVLALFELGMLDASSGAEPACASRDGASDARVQGRSGRLLEDDDYERLREALAQTELGEEGAASDTFAVAEALPLGTAPDEQGGDQVLWQLEANLTSGALILYDSADEPPIVGSRARASATALIRAQFAAKCGLRRRLSGAVSAEFAAGSFDVVDERFRAEQLRQRLAQGQSAITAAANASSAPFTTIMTRKRHQLSSLTSAPASTAPSGGGSAATEFDDDDEFFDAMDDLEDDDQMDGTAPSEESSDDLLSIGSTRVPAAALIVIERAGSASTGAAAISEADVGAGPPAVAVTVRVWPFEIICSSRCVASLAAFGAPLAVQDGDLDEDGAAGLGGISSVRRAALAQLGAWSQRQRAAVSFLPRQSSRFCITLTRENRNRR